VHTPTAPGALWRHAGFLRLWAAQTVSSFGARIAREGFAMAAILSIHAQPEQLGVLAALTLAPGVLVGLLAGGFVDRSERRTLMIASDLFRTAVLLTIPFAAWFHLLAMAQLYGAAALVGAASALFDIADHAFLPSLVARDQLIEGNAKLGVTEAVAEIGGPALAGTLFQLFTAPFALLGTAFTYLVSASFLFAIPLRKETIHPRHKDAHWLDDLRAGFAAIFAAAEIRPLFWMVLFAPLFGSFFAALYMLYGLRVLGFSPALMGIVIATGGVGALSGASLSSWLAGKLGVGRAIVVGAVASSFFALLIPLANGPLWLRIAIMMLSQFGGDSTGTAVIILSTALRQSVLPQESLGRTAALFRAAGGAAAIVGALAGGVLGETIGIRATMFVAATLYSLTPMFAAFSPLASLRDIPQRNDSDV
jgi:predicted MFS family arabinose efflux permease